MFAGWAARGLPPSVLIDPANPPGVARAQDTLLASLAGLPAGFQPGAVILAIKPQLATSLLPELGRHLPPHAVVLSILAGLPIARLPACSAPPTRSCAPCPTRRPPSARA